VDVGALRPETAIAQQPDTEDHLKDPTADPPAFVRRVADRLGIGPDEKTALGLWLLSRVGVGLLVWITVWISVAPKSHGRASLSLVWQHWDVIRYIGIAQNGYSLYARHGASIAFFPGFPGALYAVHLVLRSWVVSGLMLSFVGGVVACVALARIIAVEAAAGDLRGAELRGANGQALVPDFVSTAVRNGLTLWLCAPAAVFLTVGYPESIFLAFALPAWLAARRGRWLTAGLLLAGATALRIDGVFVLAAVAVLFLQTRPRGRDWLHGSALLIALVPLAAFFTYLYSLTGSWLAWHNAEVKGWDRTFNEPLRALYNTLRYAFAGILPASEAWEYQVEILAVAVGTALLIWLLIRRRWAEATFVGLSVGSLATSHVYLSVPREMLLWWPLWAALGVWSARRPWVETVVLTVSTPLMFAIGFLFFTGRWAG